MKFQKDETQFTFPLFMSLKYNSNLVKLPKVTADDAFQIVRSENIIVNKQCDEIAWPIQLIDF